MKNVVKMTQMERKAEFAKYLANHVKSAPRYIVDLERGYKEAPINGFESIYDITDPEVLEDLNVTSALRSSSVFTRNSVGGTAGLAGLNWYIRFLKAGRDSYYDFMRHFGIKPKAFFEWGMEAIIFPPIEEVENEWENLKHRIRNNQEVYIRGYGRDAHGTKLFTDFYEFLLKNSNVKKDPTNNSRPQTNIKKMTSLTRNKDIYNYQVSHIWGRTKNVFLFEAPWNICYTPKIIDPLTGHESKSDLPIEFQEYFIKYAQKKYKKYIKDYNKIIAEYDISSQIKLYCAENGISDDRFVDDANAELAPIIMI